MKQRDIIEINGKKYALVPDEIGEGSECENCVLADKCHEDSECICQDRFGREYAEGKKFIEVDDNTLTEEKAYDDYQERSQTAGDRGNMLAWAFVCTMFAQLIGSKYFREPYVLAAGGIAYLMLSTMQAWWQTVALWIIKCRIKSKNLRINDYPDWVGGGAWVFYWLKMIVITVTSIYAIVKFIALL